MATINLLPQAASLKGRDKKLIEDIKKLAIAGFIVLVALALVVAGYFIYTSLRLRASLAKEETLKAEIAALAQTEQSFFLISDRLTKIKGVFAKESATDQLTTAGPLVAGLPGDVRVLEVQITAKKITLGLIFPSSSAFGNFYKNLIEVDSYKIVILKSFSFNPASGYLATFELK